MDHGRLNDEKFSACLAKIGYKYKTINRKLMNTEQNIQFNRSCIKCKVMPKYEQVKINSSGLAATKAKRVAEIAWLKTEILDL